MNSEKLLVYRVCFQKSKLQSVSVFLLSAQGEGKGGRVVATPLYKLYRYMPPHRVGFLRRFALKTGIHFAHFGVESGMVFEGTTESINVFIVLIPNE